jgi:hypothetical protein
LNILSTTELWNLRFISGAVRKMEEIHTVESNSGIVIDPEKTEKPITIVEKPDIDEIDSEHAGQPGNWRSKVGISVPNFGKWNPYFTSPTLGRTGSVLWKLAKFYGPGAIISVAYIDPDNYQTSIAAGAEFQFKLLFMLLLSTVMAIYLQVGPQLEKVIKEQVKF